MPMDTALQALPTDWTALATLAFLLGLKHGFDADHLATIDGLTRHGTRIGAPHARWSGALFSLGHGAIVVAIALLVGTATTRWQTPEWLQLTGVWVSIFFLALLGLLNLRAVLTAAPDAIVAPVGIKGRFFGRLVRISNPAAVTGVGALFALSLDTISQAALFALAAGQFGGVQYAVALALLFLLGMLVTDALNGLWISRLIARADELARVASRVMGLAVGGVSLLIAALSAAKLLLPKLHAWTEERELWFGLAVVAIVLAGYLAARAVAARRGASTDPGRV
jgi:nickel/cobalt transporter (NiCoT) family protein